MKKWLVMVAVAGAAAASWGSGVRVLWTSGVGEAYGEAARAALERNANVDAAAAAVDAAEEDGEDLKAFGARVAGDWDGLTIVLAAAGNSESFGVLDRDRGVASINVSRLADGHPAAEQLAGRVTREVLRGYAWLVGLEWCPFPLCVLTGCHSPEELDSMSLNYCPPCWEKIRGLETELGFELLPVAQP
ncbi:MAG: hypothetical protein IK066_03910 [Kiritimatiellae bacterium]|nr:hypothetical protein [Kiritimatiellia bacterium]